MRVRAIGPQDMPEIACWFAALKWPLPAVDNLLPKDGMIAESDTGQPIACAFLYLTGTALALIMWTATNPAIDQKVGSAGLQAVIEHLKEAVPAAGGKLILCPVENEKLEHRFKSYGFKVFSHVRMMFWRSSRRRAAGELSSDEIV